MGGGGGYPCGLEMVCGIIHYIHMYACVVEEWNMMMYNYVSS